MNSKSSGKNGRVKGLTPSSIEAVERLATGERVHEIAGSWGVSLKTVHANLGRARRVLGARTNTHAVALYVRSQLHDVVNIAKSENGQTDAAEERLLRLRTARR